MGIYKGMNLVSLKVPSWYATRKNVEKALTRFIAYRDGLSNWVPTKYGSRELLLRTWQ
jgi:hypothetical protein